MIVINPFSGKLINTHNTHINTEPCKPENTRSLVHVSLKDSIISFSVLCWWLQNLPHLIMSHVVSWRASEDAVRLLNQTGIMHFEFIGYCRNFTLFITIKVRNRNNQRLESAGDNDRRSKRYCSIAVLGVSFAWRRVKTRVIRLRGEKGREARDQIPSILSGSPNEWWLHTCDACVRKTWRLGLR